MVSLPNRVKCRRSSREKENIFSYDGLHQSDSFYKRMRNIESKLSMFQQKMRLQAIRKQELLERLDEYSQQMKEGFLRFMDLLENSKNLIRNEVEENKDLLQMLERRFMMREERRIDVSRTQTVFPMVSGVPLKKASIFLRRLDPLGLQQSQNTSQDPAPVSEHQIAQSDTSNPLSVTDNSLQDTQTHTQTSFSRDEIPSPVYLPRNNQRHRRHCETLGYVYTSPDQEFHLKRASILLHRVDLRPYLTDTGDTQPRKCKNMPFQRSEKIETATPENCTQNVGGRIGTNCMNYASSLPNLKDPMVILKRLKALPSHNECNTELSSQQNVTSCADLSASIESESNHLNNVCDVSGGFETRLEITQSPNNEHCQRSMIKGNLKVTQTASLDEHKLSARRKSRKRLIKGVTDRNIVIKKKQSDYVNPALNLVAGSAANPTDDPLEGPSWLYNDGVNIENFKKIHRSFLTPIYYLTPTIYSSTDDSDTTESTGNEQEQIKLRKRKSKRRY